LPYPPELDKPHKAANRGAVDRRPWKAFFDDVANERMQFEFFGKGKCRSSMMWRILENAPSDCSNFLAREMPIVAEGNTAPVKISVRLR